MVVFTCNNCGESLRKQKVAQHYMMRCRRMPMNISCVDCFKDFLGNEYEKHTECITELERYGDKSAGITAPKYAKKQKEWLSVVENVLNSDKSLSKEELHFLNLLSKHKNIPRKKSKFENFVKCAMGSRRIKPDVINSVWDKLSAYKSDVQNDNTQNEKQQENGQTDENDVSMHQENSIVENQNNENIDREKQNGDHESTNGLQNGTGSNDKSKKKLKKRTASEAGQEQTETRNNTEEPITKKKKKHASTEETVSSEKNEDTLISETSINQDDANLTFSWKDAILSTVKSKGEISLKKLQDKVISRYMNFSSNTVSREKAFSKFNKKLKKVSEVIVSDEKVRLA
ncbi:cell growth-regulating nucleolar protein isoform X2 [Ceratina calcarata]|uniref:Cell growth-regulating nucleolar protein isoform X2 n=1 Tax=Ceratina calcarata TaxID=156304 RepID=A0AAJ7J925_9HYME|nr:cell growth-regulating nucleolar protein isoform X2 [Ceratina calcarata]